MILLALEPVESNLSLKFNAFDKNISEIEPVYYASRLIHDQEPHDRAWDYSLEEVYFIGIMDFVFSDSDKAKYRHYIRLAYENGKVFYKKLEFIFIEIPKFVKNLQGLDTGIDKWVYILKNLHSLNNVPEVLYNGVFKKLFDMARVTNLSKEEYRKYEDDMMALWDEYAIKETLLKEGREEGIEKGIKKGRREAQTQIIKNLLSVQKFTIEEIANFAHVSEPFVRKIKKELKK